MRPPRPALALVAALAALAGCSNSSVIPDVDLDAPTAAFALDLPAGYRVVDASADSDLAVDDGSTDRQTFLNVLAEHVATGERVLIVYEDVHKRSSPIAVFRFREGAAAGRGGR